VQELAQELFKEQKKITVKSHEKTPRGSGVREEMLSGLPKEIEEYIINPEDNCPKCGSRLKVIGKQLIRTEVEFIPAKLKVRQIVRQVAKCESCGTKDSANQQIMYQKFAMGLPYNRQLLHMDETRIQCNKEENRKASSNSFMWVMRSAASELV
jgi:transposase